MRRTHDDGVIVRDKFVLRVEIERARDFVHRRPERVGFQAQQQLADARVGLRPDVARLRLESFCRPRLQAPVFVVEEDAAILHRRRADAAHVGRDK